VEGENPDRAALSGRQGFDSLAHFLGGFIGEGDGQDSFGGNAFFDKPRDSVSDDPRFSGSRCGQNQERAFFVKNRARLFGVEKIKIHR
jgi:hypothetical protein